MLTQKEIYLLLELLAEETVVEPSEDFRYRITKRGHGYSKTHGALQAKLSIMLEVAGKAGR